MEGISGDKPACSLVWRGLSPKKVEAFGWLAVVGEVAMADNLRRRCMMSEGIFVNQ